MTTVPEARTIDVVDEMLDLRNRILRAVARRDAERPGSRAWNAADAEVHSLSRRVWRPVHPTRDDRDAETATE